MPYVITRLKHSHRGPRYEYCGILKSPKSEWPTKAQAKDSRAYKRLKKMGYEPRIKRGK